MPQHWNWLLTAENWQKKPVGQLCDAAVQMRGELVADSLYATWLFGHPNDNTETVF